MLDKKLNFNVLSVLLVNPFARQSLLTGVHERELSYESKVLNLREFHSLSKGILINVFRSCLIFLKNWFKTWKTKSDVYSPCYIFFTWIGINFMEINISSPYPWLPPILPVSSHKAGLKIIHTSILCVFTQLAISLRLCLYVKWSHCLPFLVHQAASLSWWVKEFLYLHHQRVSRKGPTATREIYPKKYDECHEMNYLTI